MRIRPLAFIRELAKQGHEVTLVCLAQPAHERQYIVDVKTYCKGIYWIPSHRPEAYRKALLSLPTGLPLSVAYCQSTELKNELHKLVLDHDWDLIHTEFIRAVPYTKEIKGIPQLFDSVDCLTLAYKRSLSASYLSPQKHLTVWFELLKIARYEKEILKYYDTIVVSSPVDQQMLSEDNNQVKLLPNGVDLEYFKYSVQQRDPLSIVFLGKMNYYVNVASVLWFYHQVYPLIRLQCPNITFKIVGRDPVDSIQKLAADPGVEVTGTVADVRPYLSNAALAIGPMVTGSGIQNKILEAMSMGAPCVVTSIVSQALKARPGDDLLVADAADAFATAVMELLQNPKKRREIGMNGRSYVEQNHDWANIGTQLTTYYSDLLQPQPSIITESHSGVIYRSIPPEGATNE
jgi:sugar transferase (PEP-CTERM/EpsH1 system associated)